MISEHTIRLYWLDINLLLTLLKAILKYFFFFFSSRRRHTRLQGDWSSDVCFSEIIRRHTRLQGDWSSDVCSSDLGCAMGCTFCATGRLGLTRNLAAWEIVAAFCAVRDEAPGRVTGAVFQGQGEPLHN